MTPVAAELGPLTGSLQSPCAVFSVTQVDFTQPAFHFSHLVDTVVLLANKVLFLPGISAWLISMPGQDKATYMLFLSSMKVFKSMV